MLADAIRLGGKLPMYLCHCSSEDESFPVTQLCRHTRRTSGWQSAKLCEYPQELGFRFEGEADLHALRLLIHETKIPSRIEIFIAEVTEEERRTGVFPPYDRAVFRRLGHVNFCSNEENHFEARELKTVNLRQSCDIRRPCVYLKLIIRKNISNWVNLFNQVGIVAVAAHGVLLHPLISSNPRENECLIGGNDEVAIEDIRPESQEETQRPMAHEALNDGVDKLSARKIKELSVHKARAIQEEDYDLAKALKAQIDALMAAGPKIVELEARKRAAVEREDYDLAKTLKKEIDAVRAGAERPKLSLSGPSAMAPAELQEHTTGLSVAVPPTTPTAETDDLTAYLTEPKSHTAAVEGSTKSPPSYISTQRPQKTSSPGKASSNFDEMPAASSLRHEPLDALKTGESGGILHASVPHAPQREEPSDAETMRPWERLLNKLILKNADKQPHAELLEGAKLAESKDLAKDFGSYAAACLLSKRWQLREAALKAVISQDGWQLVQPNSSTGLQSLLSYFAMRGFGVSDLLAGVFFLVCDALLLILQGKLKALSGITQLAPGFYALLPELMIKAGDNNGRVREQAANVLLSIAHSSLGPERVASAALSDPENPSRRPISHRVHVARIHIVGLLLDELGLKALDTVHSGLSVNSIMTRLIIPLLQHPHQDVREGAINLAVTLHSLSSAETLAHLKGLKSAQLSVMEDRIQAKRQQENNSRSHTTSQKSSSSPNNSHKSTQRGRARVSASGSPELASSSLSVGKEDQRQTALKAARAARKGS